VLPSLVLRPKRFNQYAPALQYHVLLYLSRLQDGPDILDTAVPDTDVLTGILEIVELGITIQIESGFFLFIRQKRTEKVVLWPHYSPDDRFI
jgi:hypothetical protein